MKLAIAALVAVLSTVDAASESTVHLRVHAGGDTRADAHAHELAVAQRGTKAAKPWDQCNGKTGAVPCANPDQWECKYYNEYFSQCVPKVTSTGSSPTLAAHWAPCNGKTVQCADPDQWACKYFTDSFSQCIPRRSEPAPPQTQAPAVTSAPVDGDGRDGDEGGEDGEEP